MAIGGYLLAIVCSLPVIFVHRGDSDYLEHSLWQAKQYNDRVILIGDSTNRHFEGVEHFDMEGYLKEAELFAKSYVHLSPNPFSYELFCIQRWYVINEFVRRHNIERFFYCDSDVMVYCDMSKEFSHADCDVALPSIEGYSGHNSFWSKNALNQFCHFVSLFYEKKENLHLWEERYRRQGDGFCDMTLLTEFVRTLQEIAEPMGYPRLKVSGLLSEGAVFDLCNIGHSELDAYAMTTALSGHRIKSIQWKDNQPYCYNMKRRQLLRFKTLHCQGSNKALMKSLRRLKKD
jgi:hypothetical protein